MKENIKKGTDKIPYAFILDHLAGIHYEIKPMFGCYSIFAGGRLCLFMVQRKKPILPGDRDDQNGIYVATTAKHVDSLKIDFPKAEFDMLKGNKVWMFLGEASREFEGYAIRACEMISAADGKIGR